ncbi:hypothetical protein [Alteribacillus sp. YIM 98480]|uniref:hypothetical protein n=1 Tax=Alteribacillus sp. YIM 98480 TaxID=2606599 RepID=UPI00131B0B95|nr:hypothetical protein [Alteribacillus sp. YIM 98480]
MSCKFLKDPRLGIELPILEKEWEAYEPEMQNIIIGKWEEIRGQIPERIAEIEEDINSKQAWLDIEENFEKCCQLNKEIAELASKINDLWLWYRTHPTVSHYMFS